MLSTGRLFALSAILFVTGCATSGSFDRLDGAPVYTPSEALIEQRREPLPKVREREVQETKEYRSSVGGGSSGGTSFRRVLGN